jgi:hypothetical protein
LGEGVTFGGETEACKNRLADVHSTTAQDLGAGAP